MPKEEIVNDEAILVEALPMSIENGATYSINQNNPNYATHGFFKYPCKFIPEIPRWAIKRYANKGDIIFDPFSGSGTTLLEAQLLGFDSFGTEIDPIAKKIIRAKTYHYTKDDLIAIDSLFLEFENRFNNCESIEIFIPEINNLNHWFNQENASVLGKLRTLINEIDNERVRSFFEIVFFSIIKNVSNADDTSPKPYVSNKVKKIPPNALKKFNDTFIRYRKMLVEFIEKKPTNIVEIVNGDALHTQTDKIANLAITSPPYINAFDYPRTLRLENLWMETHTEESILKSKSNYVGTEKIILKEEKDKDTDILNLSEQLKRKFDEIYEVDEKRAYIVKKFFEDMKQNMINVNQHLVVEGHYVIVIGNSVIRKKLVESWSILKDIAPATGFEYVNHFSYNIRNPYIRIPRGGRGGIIKKDYVLILRKTN